MKSSWLVLAILLLLSANATELTAQQTEADLKVFEALKTEAKKGDPKAQYECGLIYNYGRLGVPKDSREAFRWFLKAGEQGHAQAQCFTAACYYLGIGVAEDTAQTINWLRKAGEQGDSA